MATFHIVRKQFLDRVMGVSELSALTDMLREWHHVRSGGASGAAGQCWCEARVMSAARAQLESLQQSLPARLPGAKLDASDPDALRVTGPSDSVDRPADTRVWTEVLAAPQVRNACVMLRFTIHVGVGPQQDRKPTGATTLVLFGEPVGGDGSMLVKAIWPLGLDESMQLVFRWTHWDREQHFLNVFEMFLQKTAGRQDPSKTAAAVLSRDMFARGGPELYLSAGKERMSIWLTRQFVELPDDHGLGAFIRRLIPPLLFAAVAIVAAVLYHASGGIEAMIVVFAGLMLCWAGGIIWLKLRRIRRYYKAMRTGIGKLYSAPITSEVVDVSAEHSPTRTKYTADLQAIGARYICDMRINSARGALDANRFFALNNMTVVLGLLRKTENLQFFPSQPILFVTTRFKDGTRHLTVNRTLHRKPHNRKATARCMLDDTGSLEQLLALHRKHVERLISTGRVPNPPPATAQQVAENLRTDHEDSQELWKQYPYSWGDAIHEGFNICRREYLAD